MARHDIGIIKYEDLYNDFEWTLSKINNDLRLNRDKSLFEYRKPTLKDKCVFPRKGIIGDWKNHFTEEDKIFFNNQVRLAMKLAGY